MHQLFTGMSGKGKSTLTRKIVAEWYAPEIGLLHYEF